MANELVFIGPNASMIAYAVIRNVAMQVWYPTGQAFEDYGTGNRDADDYDIALTGKSAGCFLGDFDANISAGYYYVIFYDRAGANPADTDIPYGQEYGYWDGSNWKRLPNMVSDLYTPQEVSFEATITE